MPNSTSQSQHGQERREAVKLAEGEDPQVLRRRLVVGDGQRVARGQADRAGRGRAQEIVDRAVAGVVADARSVTRPAPAAFDRNELDHLARHDPPPISARRVPAGEVAREGNRAAPRRIASFPAHRRRDKPDQQDQDNRGARRPPGRRLARGRLRTRESRIARERGHDEFFRVSPVPCASRQTRMAGRPHDPISWPRPRPRAPRTPASSVRRPPCSRPRVPARPTP